MDIDFNKLHKEASVDRVEGAMIALLDTLGFKPKSEQDLTILSMEIERILIAAANVGFITVADWAVRQKQKAERGY